MTAASIIYLVFMSTIILFLLFGKHATNGHIDGKVDAMFRDSMLDNTNMQRDEPDPKHKWRHALYVHFYKRGWARELAREWAQEERMRQGIKPIMRDNNGWQSDEDPTDWGGQSPPK